MKNYNFRVWLKYEKKLLYFDKKSSFDYYFLNFNSKFVLCKYDELYNNYFEDKDIIVMEDIGLKDRNNNLIYLGDIIKKSYYNGFVYLYITYFQLKPVAIVIPELPYEYVIFTKHTCLNDGTDIHYYDVYQCETYDLEIVGNIFESKELIKKSKLLQKFRKQLKL